MRVVAGTHTAHPIARRILALHLAQLSLNALWPQAFFARGRKPVSLAIIGALDVTLAAEVAWVAREDPVSAARWVRTVTDPGGRLLVATSA